MQPRLGSGQSTDYSVASTRPPPQLSSSGYHQTPSRSDAVIDFNTPSKVFTVTYALITAYRCAAEILEPGKGSIGWAALRRPLEILGRHGSDSKVREVLDMDTLLGTLMQIIHDEIIPLANTKVFLKAKSNEDHQAMRLVLTESALLLASYRLTRNDHSAILLSTPKHVLYRCILCILHGKTEIDLSKLGVATIADLGQLGNQIEQVMKTLNAPLHQIRSMDLSGNRLTGISSYFLSAFPNLYDLDISNNPIRTFPMTIIRTPVFRIIRKDKTGKFDVKGIPKSLTFHNALPPQPRSTLVQSCLRVLHRHSSKTDLFALGLPIKLQDVIARSYICDMCDRVDRTAGGDPVRHVRLRYGKPSIRLSGLLCVLCINHLVFLLKRKGELIKKIRVRL